MARAAIDTLTTYYRTLRSPSTGQDGSSLILSTLRRREPGQLQFDALRRETDLAPVELATTLRTLQDLDLVTIRRVDNDDAVEITDKGKRMFDELQVE